MMNQYYGQPYGFSGRGGRDPRSAERSPYRRPVGRGTMPTSPNHRGGGGCGCDLSLTNRGENPLPRRNCPEKPPKAEPCTATSVRPSKENSCGCGDKDNGNHTSCKKLLEQIRTVDFALYETILYLDVYPHSCDALETYHKLKAQQKALRKEYESLCGPLTAFGNQSQTSWDWISKPFPWEYDAD